jgi:putative ABC transport system permease protein
MSQFLIESVVICLLGGMVGVILGFGGTLAVALALGWSLVLPQVAAVGLGVSIAIGLFFGVYPASKAARLPPVVALSRE